MILGGAGGLGRTLARHLARTHRARLALIGRREQDPAIDALLAEITELGGEESTCGPTPPTWRGSTGRWPPPGPASAP
ncbi:KR domain-containing protein [Streptomyces nogalater]